MGIRDKEWAKRSGNEYIITWKRCRLGKFGNVRTEFPEETIAIKANDLILNGQKNPISGKLSDDGEWFEYSDGDMRVRGCAYADRELHVDMDTVLKGGLRCVLDGLPDDAKAVKLFQIKRGTDTTPLSTLDLAKALKGLKDSGMSTNELAVQMSRSDQYIRDMIRLASTAPELQQAVQQGAMSPTTAIKTSKAREDAQTEVKEKLERGERVKGCDVPDGKLKVMSPEEIQGEIKKADRNFTSAKTEKERFGWQFYIRALRSTIGLDEKL